MPYPALIHKEADSDYGVSFPDFPGCVTAGATPDEAHAMAEEALQGHVDCMIDAGLPVPEPTALARAYELAAEEEALVVTLVPARVPQRARRVNVTIDAGLLEEIDRSAAARGMNRSAFLAEGARRLMASG